MIFNPDLCVVLEGGEKITPLCNSRNLRDAPFKTGPEKITHIYFHGVLGFYLLTCEGPQLTHSSHFPHSPTVSWGRPPDSDKIWLLDLYYWVSSSRQWILFWKTDRKYLTSVSRNVFIDRKHSRGEHLNIKRRNHSWCLCEQIFSPGRSQDFAAFWTSS